MDSMVALVTGGCGFIGSNFLCTLVPRRPDITFVNLDALTYAANPLSVQEIDSAPNYRFVQADLRDTQAIQTAFETYRPDLVIHFAAESHVDRSIDSPADFLTTNVIGTLNLLEAARATWSSFEGKVFHHVSTDEVYGSLGDTGYFTETTPYDPSSPYSASKAGSDHLVRAYHRTFGLPVKVTNCSNNYGPKQFPEKLIPLMIGNAIAGKPLPVYGDGQNVRDWLYVTDHCEAIWQVVEHGRIGETYNIGGNSERKNIDVVLRVCELVAKHTGRTKSDVEAQITYVKDRPGHDRRYAIDAGKIQSELGWQPTESFETGLEKTVLWYLSNEAWVNSITSGAYRRQGVLS